MKVTKRTQYESIVEVLTTAGPIYEDLVDFAKAQIALLDKRKTATRGASKTQIENAGIKELIVSNLETLEGEGATATEIAESMDISVQKATQLVKQLVDAGTIVRTEGKGKVKTTFSVAR